MRYVKVMIHYVWATKNRQPILTAEIKKSLFAHIKENAKRKNIYIDKINGWLDHVHYLISLQTGQAIVKIIQMIKGESSYWFNHFSGFDSSVLYWQEEYFAVLVRIDVRKNTELYRQPRKTIKEQKALNRRRKCFQKYMGLNCIKVHPGNYKT